MGWFLFKKKWNTVKVLSIFKVIGEKIKLTQNFYTKPVSNKKYLIFGVNQKQKPFSKYYNMFNFFLFVFICKLNIFYF